MTDPLTEVVTLLQPTAPFSKIVEGAGQWSVSPPFSGYPFYCAVLEGACHLTANDQAPITLIAGDFVLIPEVLSFSTTSLDPPPPDTPDTVPTQVAEGHYRLGHPAQPAEIAMLVGHCEFGSPDTAMLISLLPRLIHVRGQHRLATLVELVREESRSRRPARDVILARLLEVMLIEAFRAAPDIDTLSPSLTRGLADERLANALRSMHASPARAWTMAQLAREAALSRSTFFERFQRVVGVPPMEYLVAWRLALAKRMLRHKEGSLAEIAERVGYSSASTFSVAFSRHTGISPGRYENTHSDDLTVWRV